MQLSERYHVFSPEKEEPFFQNRKSTFSQHHGSVHTDLKSRENSFHHVGNLDKRPDEVCAGVGERFAAIEREVHHTLHRHCQTEVPTLPHDVNQTA